MTVHFYFLIRIFRSALFKIWRSNTPCCAIFHHTSCITTYRNSRIVVAYRLGTLGSADSLLVGARLFALLGCQPGKKTIVNRFFLVADLNLPRLSRDGSSRRSVSPKKNTPHPRGVFVSSVPSLGFDRNACVAVQICNKRKTTECCFSRSARHRRVQCPSASKRFAEPSVPRRQQTSMRLARSGDEIAPFGCMN